MGAPPVSNFTPFAGGISPSIPSFTGGSLDSTPVGIGSNVIGSSDYQQMLFDKTAEASRIDANASTGEVVKKDGEYHYSENGFGTKISGIFMLAPKGQILFETDEVPKVYRIPTRKAITDMTQIYAKMFQRNCVGARTETENCQGIKAILARYEPSLLTAPSVTKKTDDPSDPFAESNRADYKPPASLPVSPPNVGSRSAGSNNHGGGPAGDSGRTTVAPTDVFKVWSENFVRAARFADQTEVASFAKSFLDGADERTSRIQCSAKNRLTGAGHDGTDKVQLGFLTVKQENGKKVFVLSGAGAGGGPSKGAVTAELKVQEANDGKKAGIAYLRASDPACADPFFPDLDARQYEIRSITGKNGKRGYMLHYQAPGLFDVYCDVPL